MKRKSTKKGQSQTVTCSWWSPVTLLSRTASWGDFFCLFFFFFGKTRGEWWRCAACENISQRVKGRPSPTAEDCWDPTSALLLEPFRCDTSPVPWHGWSGLSNRLLPVGTCLGMTTPFLPECVFSFSETWWQWPTVDANARLCGGTVWCADRGKQGTAV